MSSAIQLLCLIISFGYGFIFGLFLTINFTVFKRKNKIYLFLSFILLSFIFSLIYIYINYYLNKGIIHIYFYILILWGYIVFRKCQKSLIKCKLINKIFKKN